jgi:Mn2+/Fe2+ NRAMP family transporter
MAVAASATATRRPAAVAPASSNPFVAFFSRFVGPAALTAAGMIGAGAIATRLLAGAWFGFGLLWVALYLIPLVIITLDSASRVAMMSGGRGMIEMIRSEIGAWVAWLIFAAAFLVNLVVNMSQMAAMVEGTYGAFGRLPPVTAGVGFGLITVALTAASVTVAVLGGYKRVERVMAFLLVAKLICFIIVATKGLLDWYTWPALVDGLVPHVPADVPVVGTTHVREGLTQMLAIAGQALPPTVFLTYGYLHSNAGYTRADAKRAFWKTVYNLGFLWGLFSVVVIVAGTTALHNVYTGHGPSFLGVSHFSQIESIPVAGQVLGPAFPGVFGFLAPRFFSVGLVGAGFTTLISVSLTMTYICLDVARRDWHFTRENKTFQTVFALWIAIPALLTPFWALPALLKAIVAMIGNLLLAPVAVAVIFYFVNQRRMGEFKANVGRNLLLAVTLVFAFGLAVAGAVRFLR